MADFISVYGFPAGFTLDYRTFFQLFLNLERVRMQKAIAVAFGNYLANSDSPLDESWGDAVALDKSEAAEITYQANIQRANSRMRRKRPGGMW